MAIKPVNKTNEIDRCRNGQMLHMRFRRSHRTRTAEVESPYLLRNGRLNPRPQSLSLLEGFRLLKLACNLECGMLRDASLMTSVRRG